MAPEPTIISQSAELEADRNSLKVFVLGLLGIAASFLTIYFFNKLLSGSGSGNLLWCLIVGFVFLILTVLKVFLVKSLAKLNLLVFLEILAALAVFYPHLYPEVSWPLVLGALAFFIFLVLGISQGVRLLVNSIKVKTVLTAKLVIPKAVTGLLIFLSVVLYLNYFEWGRFTETMGQSFVAQFLSLSRPAFKLLAPDFTPSQSVKEFFYSLSENQLRRLKAGELIEVMPNFSYSFDQLPLEVKTRLIVETAARLKLSAEKIIGPLSWNDSVGRAVFLAAENYFNRLPLKLKSTLGIGIAVVFFVLMKGVAVLFYWLIEILALLILRILFVTGFAYISIENRSREFILLK